MTVGATAPAAMGFRVMGLFFTTKSTKFGKSIALSFAPFVVSGEFRITYQQRETALWRGARMSGFGTGVDVLVEHAQAENLRAVPEISGDLRQSALRLSASPAAASLRIGNRSDAALTSAFTRSSTRIGLLM